MILNVLVYRAWKMNLIMNHIILVFMNTLKMEPVFNISVLLILIYIDYITLLNFELNQIMAIQIILVYIDSEFTEHQTYKGKNQNLFICIMNRSKSCFKMFSSF